MKTVKKTDDFGNEYEDVEFDTSAFGTFYEVSIEEIDNVEYIVAMAKIWKRFTEACEVIKSRVENGGLSTSWEVTVIKNRVANYLGKPLKIIEQGCFFGHCLLSEDIKPAYDSSRLLNVAAKKTDVDLENALINDIYKISQKEDDLILGDTNKKENSTTELETSKETSALTEWDLRDKIRDACKLKLGKWCYLAFHFPTEKTVWVEVDGRDTELDYVLFTYEVENDIVTMSEPTNVKLTISVSEVNSTIEKLNTEISTRDETILTLNKNNKELSNKVSNLTPFKEKFEVAEQERIEQEKNAKKSDLKNKLIQSSAITIDEIETSAEIQSMIDNLDENAINKFVVDRIISSTSDSKQSNKVEVAQVSVIKKNIVDSDDNSGQKKVTHTEFMKAYIG